MSNDIRKDIERLYDHARIANEEMGVIKADVNVIKNDINWIKQEQGEHRKLHERHDARLWWILGSIILGFISTIALSVWR